MTVIDDTPVPPPGALVGKKCKIVCGIWLGVIGTVAANHCGSIQVIGLQKNEVGRDLFCCSLKDIRIYDLFPPDHFAGQIVNLGPTTPYPNRLMRVVSSVEDELVVVDRHNSTSTKMKASEVVFRNNLADDGWE